MSGDMKFLLTQHEPTETKKHKKFIGLKKGLNSLKRNLKSLPNLKLNL